MSDPALQPQIDAANAYEQLFVPALFRQWTTKVSDAARLEPGQRVLDVACGTGVLAREAFSRVGSKGHVAGIDPVPGMLAVANNLSPTSNGDRELQSHCPSLMVPSTLWLASLDLCSLATKFKRFGK